MLRHLCGVALLVVLSIGWGCAAQRVPTPTVQRGSGDVKLAAVFGPNMVLQRGRPLTFWGWAPPGQEVRVWVANRHGRTTADAQGRWRITLGTLRAGGPHQLTIAGHDVYTVDNVMIGEVWLCAGQSNMQWSVKRSGDAQRGIAEADLPNIRLFTVPRRPTAEPADDVDAAWVVCSPQTVGDFSAVAYYFGRHLHDELDVPIGLMNVSWGGTPIEPWIPREALTQNPTAMDYAGGIPDPLTLEGHPKHPTIIYNGMIAPLSPFTIRGVLWYQGESNVTQAWQYQTLLRTLIAGWRQAWQTPDLSFYLVQLAPFNYRHHPAMLAELREAQLKVARSIPNTGIVVTTDIGDLSDIHPANKREVGRRLALWALAKDYRRRHTVFSGPLYRDHRVEGNRIRVMFDHVDGGLVARGGPLLWWQIAGDDRQFVEAQAEIDGDSVIVWAEQVTEPTAVRFGWHHSAEPNLFNRAALPASPFRTDDAPLQSQSQ